MLIAYDKNNEIFRTIAGPAKKNCDLNSGMCYVEYFDYSDEAPECAKYLFLSKSYEELNEVCHFKCEPAHKRTLVRKLNTNEYLLSNYQRSLFLYNTANQSRTPLEINYYLPGAIYIYLPCEYQLFQSDGRTVHTLIPENFPCKKILFLETFLLIQGDHKISKTKMIFNNFS